MAGVFDRSARERELAGEEEEEDFGLQFSDYIKVELKTETTGWDDIPTEIGPQFEGERIRGADTAVEFGGPKVDYSFERVYVLPPGSDIEHEKVTVIGPELDELGGGSHRIGFIVEVCSNDKEIPPEMEGTFSARLHYWGNYIAGFMHLNTRETIWIRVSKELLEKGFKLEHWGKIIARLFVMEIPVLDKAQITIITDPDLVKEKTEEAIKYWKELDEKMAAMTEEETRPWYTCTLCQSFASSHVCVITPQRPANCGAISWADAKAGHTMDPAGDWQPFDPGECLDPIRGEWSGMNETVTKLSGGINTRYYLHSIFGYTHTSCGCFEMIAFYIPEVDGIGLVARAYTEPTVNKLPFSTMAARTGGGQQTEGLLGLSVRYLPSPKFWQADGGWRRVVWMNSGLMERHGDAIPEEMKGKIATEKDVKDIAELKEFLKKCDHPVVTGVIRPVDGKKITEGWKRTFNAEGLLEYIEEHGGELDPEEAAEEFGVDEEDIMDLVEEMVEDGLLEE
ncbi:CO dehydrogenase/CO-methylating acetyl-CoA synthase complex subunit beta [Methanosarcinales archaeon]|uniref:CO-methylating acetyl-CoA synthase n=1 Tax=Candidatus Syntropharchaeum caldarium TaxID=1838285 RepID=A0A1F2P918_9EURY|nr:MAG: CO dehydrogenase/acetyl-CoA synthase complex beta subunit [Candidatus Syntrophoarchaeum caldarius]RLG35465.1 MAG: CO dehydrogenase/CO-methylating acetyl-CoA synthase complex subunit beta [Methanosarcinales archaeon]